MKINTMLTSSSVVQQPELKTGAASLAGELFHEAGYSTIILEDDGNGLEKVVPPRGKLALCSHCNKSSFAIINDCIVVIQRHDSQWHKTIMPLKDLGYIRGG